MIRVVLPAHLRTLAGVNGEVVLEVQDNTPAARLGVKRGDFIVAVNDDRVGSVAELATALQVPSGRWLLSLERKGRLFNLAIQG